MRDSDATRIGVLVVNFASSELLAANLAPLSRARPDLLVVVVDNRTTDDEWLAVDAIARAEGWSAVRQQENTGFGAAMNTAALTAIDLGADRLLLLNPDASLPAASLDLLSAAVGERALVGPTILRPDGSVWSAGSDLGLLDGRVWGRRRRPEGAQVMEWLTGACLMLSVALWQEIGGFDDHYFLYWEDVDLSWKVHAVGGAVALVPEAVAVHDAGGTQQGVGSAARPKSAIYYYFNIRNRLVFAALRLDRTTQRRWWATTPGIVWGVLRIGGKRHLLRSVRPWRAAAHGVVDGWRTSRALRQGRQPAVSRTERRLR